MLSGKTENYGTPDDPWPVPVEGTEKPVPSTKIEEYVNENFRYYWNFYLSCKNAGPPFSGGWTDWPVWTVQLLNVFGSIMEAEKLRHERDFQARIHGCRIK